MEATLPPQMADLFGRDITVIRRHLKAIFADGELDEDSVSAKSALTAADGKTYNTSIYSLDVVLAVGYRVQANNQAIMFRRWANDILRQYLISGYVVDVPRLENPDERPDPTTIQQFLQKMRELLKLDGRPVIRDGHLGSISMDAAKKKASAEIKAYKERIRIEREIQGEKDLRQLGEKVKRRRK